MAIDFSKESSMKFRLRQFITLLRTINLGALYFWKDAEKFKNYLRQLNKIFLSWTSAPIRPMELSELLGKDFCSNVFIPLGNIKPGSTPLADLVALAALAIKKRPINIFEIGTFEGLTSVVFVKNLEPKINVFTLDLPLQKEVPRTRRSFKAQSVAGPYQSGYLIDAMGCSRQIKRLFGDSALFDFKAYENSIDLFFIDGAHTADYVARDSLNAFQAIVPDGWIIWHDCFIPEVSKILREIARHHPILHIRETNLVLSTQKPNKSFPWNRLEKKII